VTVGRSRGAVVRGAVSRGRSTGGERRSECNELAWDERRRGAASAVAYGTGYLLTPRVFSDRVHAASTFTMRGHDFGGRGVRSAP
jgi:hypothetical protein